MQIQVRCNIFNGKIKMHKSFLIILLNIVFLFAGAHPWKPAHYIIIDTDGGMDDLRTLSMLLASPNIRVLAITSSNGVIDAETAYIKIKSFLTDLHHEGILTGMNSSHEAISKGCKPALNLAWGDANISIDSIPEAISVINYVLSHTRDKISFVSLGSLVTASDCAKKCPLFRNSVKEIIWTSDSIMNENNFNYTVSPESFLYLRTNTSVPIHLICGTPAISPYDEPFMSVLNELGDGYSKRMVKSMVSVRSEYATRWFDESASIFLHYPSCFSSDTSGNIIYHHLLRPCSADSLKKMTITILKGETVNQNQVLKSFPMDTVAYFTDVQKKMLPTIEKYGKDEWTACVLGNEMHRHLGVYAVIGVKMGIRAREYFGAGIDELQIHSYAGLTPPYSCMNDGLQVSTGATLGHGLIEVNTDSTRLPKADFTYLGQTITISLKEEYRQRIEAEINELSMIYGLDSNIYWELVRMAALKYWANWDRNNIFEIRPM